VVAPQNILRPLASTSFPFKHSKNIQRLRAL
jgi:hypothetical protein